jgi:predicted DNA-binding protein with PD1-like motif
VKSYSTEKARHLVLRAGHGETLPDSLVAALRDEVVTCGWLRASGVLSHVELRAFSAEVGGPAAVRRIAGPVQVLALEGSVGLSRGDISVGMRALLAREGDVGVETIAGEIVSARVHALEAHVTALDDLALERALDPAAGVWVLGEPGATPAGPPRVERPRPPTGAPAAPPAAWGDAIAASAERPAYARPATPAGPPAVAAVPPKPKLPSFDDGSPTPEAGDFVEHFAFGPCDVVKSDGDRLHVRMHKDGRIKEIAVAMLKVSPLENVEGKRAYKLERKL